jgi:diacylglycerol kinase family enzyme
MPNTRYSITADGRRRMMSGITCVVCNSGNLGIQGVKLIPEIDPSDGYLNVVVFRQASLIAALGLAYNAISGFVTRRKGAGRVRLERKDLTMYSIPAKEVVIEASPPQVAARDGEEINGGFPLRIGVLHNAINVAAHRREWE